MYGLIGKFICVPGRREELIGVLVAGSTMMPGCLRYVVARDLEDPAGVWVTEVWDSKESHEGSLLLPAVQAAITKARPLIAGFGPRYETEPAGAMVE